MELRYYGHCWSCIELENKNEDNTIYISLDKGELVIIETDCDNAHQYHELAEVIKDEITSAETKGLGMVMVKSGMIKKVWRICGKVDNNDKVLL